MFCSNILPKNTKIIFHIIGHKFAALQFSNLLGYQIITKYLLLHFCKKYTSLFHSHKSEQSQCGMIENRQKYEISEENKYLIPPQIQPVQFNPQTEPLPVQPQPLTNLHRHTFDDKVGEDKNVNHLHPHLALNLKMIQKQFKVT